MELGPLHSPLVTRAEADVRYVDLHLAPELRAHYASHPGFPLDDIVDVDFALFRDGKRRSLTEAVETESTFDWIIASHAIEHVPDLIGWLADVANVLADGALLVLAIPDRRYCFDALRPPTTVGAMLQAHLLADTRPSIRAVFDHFDSAVAVDLERLWNGGSPSAVDRIHGTNYAWEQMQEALTGTYVDCHVWLFTPYTFVAQLQTLAELGHLDLTLACITPTAAGEDEFIVSLARIPRDLGPDEQRAALQAGFRDEVGTAAWCERPEARVPMSPPELRALQLKRALVRRGRALIAKSSKLVHRSCRM